MKPEFYTQNSFQNSDVNSSLKFSKFQTPIGSIDRRQFLKLASLFSLSTALTTGCNTRQFLPKKEDPILRIGYLPITDSSPLLAARDKGFYAAEGLEVAPPAKFRSWDAITQAFMAREVNLIHLLMPTTMWVRYGAKFPGKVVAWNHTNGSAITVLPEINKPEDLGGRTIAVPSWLSIHNIVLQMLLRQHGLEPITTLPSGGIQPQQVHLKMLPPPDMLAELQAQQIAGYIVAEPFNSAAESLKVGKLLRLTSDIWRDHACCVVFMHEEDIKQHPDWTQAVVNSLVKSQYWSKTNRRELAHLLSKEGGQYLPFSSDVLSRVLTNYDNDFYHRQGAIVHPEWRSARVDFQPFPFASYTRSLVQEFEKTLVGQSKASSTIDPTQFLTNLSPNFIAEDLVDDSFVRRALPLVGGPQAFNLTADLSRQEMIDID
jgi:NitT/TauT family transport system substrate-binding protein